MSLEAAFRRVRRWLLKDSRRAFARAALVIEGFTPRYCTSGVDF
jgi:hypothetical protein